MGEVGGDAVTGLMGSDWRRIPKLGFCLVLGFEILGGFCLNPCLSRGERPAAPLEKSLFVLEKNVLL